MDVCSPYVVIRMLGLVGLILFVSGLYFNAQRDQDIVWIHRYNDQVKAWTDGARAQFELAEFQIEVARPGLRGKYLAPLLQDSNEVDGSTLMIPPGWRKGLTSYKPLQSLRLLAAKDVVGGSNASALALLGEPLNVSLRVITEPRPPAPPPGSNGNHSSGSWEPNKADVTTLKAGDVTLYTSWPTLPEARCPKPGGGCLVRPPAGQPQPALVRVHRAYLVHHCPLLLCSGEARGRAPVFRRLQQACGTSRQDGRDGQDRCRVALA